MPFVTLFFEVFANQQSKQTIPFVTLFFAVFAIQQSKQTIPFVTLFFAVSASRDDTNRQNFQSALLLPTT